MNGTQNEEQESAIVPNGTPTMVPSHSTSLGATKHNSEELSEDQDSTHDEPPVVQIERDLDELTYSGAAINDLEMQLTRSKHLYQQVLVDGKLHVDMLRRKLHSHIVKSEPFIDIWRKARQVQDLSNRAAARYDKANSQHTAAKEMIRVAESQLAACREEQEALEEPISPSPLDLAWQEMLNHATAKVVVTERERRDSEMEHRRVLEECKKIMEDYRAVERKLRTHIVKSRPYFQERYRINQHLAKLKDTMKHLEQKINESKQSYSASLKRLEVLNTEMHERRAMHSSSHHYLDPRQISSTGTSPEMMRARLQIDTDDVVSVDSLQLSKTAGDFNGSTGSLPSIGVLSSSELSQSSESDTRSLENPLRNSEFPPGLHSHNQVLHRRSSSQGQNGGPWYHDMSVVPSSLSRHDQERSNSTHIVRPSHDQAKHPSNRAQEHRDSTVPSTSYHNQDDGLSDEDLCSVPSHHVPDLRDSSNDEPEEPFEAPSYQYLSVAGLDASSHVSRVASDIVVQSLATALSRLNQEAKDTET